MIDHFHLESLSPEELSSLRQALDQEEKRRARIDSLDAQIAALKRELETAPLMCTSQVLRPTLYAGGYAPSQRCGCRACVRAELKLLEDRRMLEATL